MKYTSLTVILLSSALPTSSFTPAALRSLKPTEAEQAKKQCIQAAASLSVGAFLMLANPSPAAAGDVGRGQQLFDMNCASCHGGGNNYVKEQKTLKRDALEKFGVGVEQKGIQDWVTKSQQHKNLVFFKMDGGKLNEQQWEDVTTYVADQASGEKWGN